MKVLALKKDICEETGVPLVPRKATVKSVSFKPRLNQSNVYPPKILTACGRSVASRIVTVEDQSVVLIGGDGLLAPPFGAEREPAHARELEPAFGRAPGEELLHRIASHFSNVRDIYERILITHRPAENTHNVFSYITGYAYKPGGDATVTIDGSRHVLFTQDDTAWAPDADTDSLLSLKIRSGSSMVVEGTSSRGTATKDTFGLKGSGAALDAINKECGLM